MAWSSRSKRRGARSHNDSTLVDCTLKLGSIVHLTELLNQVPVYVWLGLYNCRIQLRYREQLYGMSALDGIYTSNGIQGLLRQLYALSFSGLSLWYAVYCMRKIPPGIAYSQRRRSRISRQVCHYLLTLAWR